MTIYEIINYLAMFDIQWGSDVKTRLKVTGVLTKIFNLLYRVMAQIYFDFQGLHDKLRALAFYRIMNE